MLDSLSCVHAFIRAETTRKCQAASGQWKQKSFDRIQSWPLWVTRAIRYRAECAPATRSERCQPLISPVASRTELAQGCQTRCYSRQGRLARRLLALPHAASRSTTSPVEYNPPRRRMWLIWTRRRCSDGGRDNTGQRHTRPRHSLAGRFQITRTQRVQRRSHCPMRTRPSRGRRALCKA